MTSPPRLSVLEVVPIGPDVSAQQAFAWTTQLAGTVEALGYHRLWVAEHHGVSDIGSCAPAVLLAHLAASTTTLRLGSGGVLLNNHAPLAVAEQFSILNALHAGRIDLGIGRGRGASPLTLRALGLSETTSAQVFVDKLDMLLGWINGTLPAAHPYAAVTVSPRPRPLPVFLLGSGIDAAQLAARLGLSFAFAHHLSPDITTSALTTYRALFRASEGGSEPYTIVTIAVACAETRDVAEREAVAATTIRARRMLAEREGSTPSSDELLSPQLNQDEAVLVAELLASPSMFIGTPKSLSEQMGQFSTTTGADELMLIPMQYDGPARIRTLTLARTKP
jgi:luciferase family oxidoreductase group 1